ncbi:transglycosylase domain-containing protein [Aquimarina longa]|uniref:transglycosylase domain-containing protein n=1 Tax=Aquimarina longa TaxID=1080221 RepID=UPI0009E74469|nr:transglycosylase domain-containing protein [Aquimarina longa]
MKNELLRNRYVLAWKLEKELSQNECLNYLVVKYDFLYNTTGIYQASRFYFNTELDSLDKKQSTTLILVMKNAWLYNPRKAPERIKNN